MHSAATRNLRIKARVLQQSLQRFGSGLATGAGDQKWLGNRYVSLIRLGGAKVFIHTRFGLGLQGRGSEMMLFFVMMMVS